MENGSKPRQGGCMCGAVRYEVSGDAIWVGFCHCKSCRAHTGAPVVTFACFVKEHVRFHKGQRQIYNSSPGVERGFCGNCGTPMTWEGKSNLPERGDIIEFYISTFDEPDEFIPINHVWYPDKISWFDVADDLPRYEGFDFNSELCHKVPNDE